MNNRESVVLESGRRVGLVLAGYVAELDEFGPLKEANEARADLVAAIGEKAGEQQQETESATTSKEELREQLAQAAATLSDRAVGYAMSVSELGLKQALTLTYTDVRYGDADEDVAAVRTLVARAQALPTAALTRFRITAAVLQAPLTAATAFEQGATAQQMAKTGTRLATLALPELLTRLRAQLLLLEQLAAGMRTDANPRWAALYRDFREANKRRGLPAARGTVVRRLLLHRQDGQAVRLATTNYRAAYTLTVENRSGNALLLWMAQRDGAETTPQTCAAGKVTVVTRAALGPETARYLTARFGGEGGGEATVVVRRVE